jgi:hypothetical protein
VPNYCDTNANELQTSCIKPSKFRAHVRKDIKKMTREGWHFDGSTNYPKSRGLRKTLKNTQKTVFLTNYSSNQHNEMKYSKYVFSLYKRNAGNLCWLLEKFVRKTGFCAFFGVLRKTPRFWVIRVTHILMLEHTCISIFHETRVYRRK